MSSMFATPLPVPFAPTPCLAPGVVEVFAGIGSVARGFAEGAQLETLLLNDIDPIARKAYLAHAGDSAMVKITADDGKNYDLKLSLNGFSPAHDSMAEQAKQKAKTPPANAAAAPAK